MTNQRNVWVFIEQEEGQLAEVSLELLGKGRDLANKLSSELWAVLGGYRVGELAETAVHSGADRVLLADHPELEFYRTLPYARLTIEFGVESGFYHAQGYRTAFHHDFAPFHGFIF